MKSNLGRVRLGSIRNKNNWNNASKRLFGSYSRSGIPGFPFRLFYSQEQNSRNIFRNIFRNKFLFRNIPNERALKVPISSKFLFFHLVLHFMQWTSAKKIFDLDKKRLCYDCLKTWKSYFLAIDPYRWSQHRHAKSCDVDSGTCDFRFDLAPLFYLCKFSFVVHAKFSLPACCMNYYVRFTEVKQAR